jgi:hypothetical protein
MKRLLRQGAAQASKTAETGGNILFFLVVFFVPTALLTLAFIVIAGFLTHPWNEGPLSAHWWHYILLGP